MPSYEYECQLCKARVELVQSLDKHEAPAICPSCNMEHTMMRVNIPSSSIPVEETESTETTKE
ncbi:MAG: zinc ribbon domain-containing protein [Spirochaetia bacterium]|nr:zinc ribbon domain-containing protein [Sphaerochaeta sp.]NCC12344.1 zinc ribbon domain-containing protein [Spirochaetia bacterium]NCC89093.1 zinc ribbon domain-containing protein [Spirochaetia bacterium]